MTTGTGTDSGSVKTGLFGKESTGTKSSSTHFLMCPVNHAHSHKKEGKRFMNLSCGTMKKPGIQKSHFTVPLMPNHTIINQLWDFQWQGVNIEFEYQASKSLVLQLKSRLPMELYSFKNLTNKS